MSTLNDKVVWITGASSGIGEALAMACAKKGAKLVLSSRREEELEKVKAKCNTEALILRLDLNDTNNIDALTQKVIEHFGRIDILVNNGGMSQRSLVKDTSMEMDRKFMEVNYFGQIALTKSVLPHMIKNKSGHVVVMSSIAGKFGYYLRSAYSAAKHALHGFFESLRMEVFNDNIKVTIICPGKIRTNISYNALNEKGEKHNVMDPSQDRGMSAEVCAKEIINAIEKDKFEVFIGGKELRAIWVKRFFPNLFTRKIRKRKT